MTWFGCESQENTLLYLIEVCEVKSMLKIFRIEKRNKCFEPKCMFLSKNDIFSVGSRDVTSISSRSLKKYLGPQATTTKTTTAVKTSPKKWSCVLSDLIASIWTRSICQMLATSPGVEFVRMLFKFKKRKENSSSYVHVLHKTSN